MIDSVRGKLAVKQPTHVVIDVQGVGYGLHIPLSTYASLGEIESTQEHCTYLYVRDNAMQLYGFASAEEKELFQLLLSVSGVGPRMALGVLSGLSVSEFREAVNSGDVSMLMTIPGIGKKKGERLLLELKDKIGVELGETVTGEVAVTTVEGRLIRDAMSALLSLGCKPPEARRAIQGARKVFPEGGDLEELIKEALKHL